MTKLKVIHVWNVAGVASVIAKWMDHLCGTESTVVMGIKSDRYGLTVYGEHLRYIPKTTVPRLLWKARNFDVIHVHGWQHLLPYLRLYRKHSRLIMQYHHSNMRNRWAATRKFWRLADAIFYSTKDMEGPDMPSHAVYVPNPVDTSLFHSSERNPTPDSALTVDRCLDLQKARDYATKFGLTLAVYDSNIPYKKMSGVLDGYEYYVDTKTSGFSLSKIGLEALACGLKVINFYGETIKELPGEHKPENVSRQVYEIYVNLLEEMKK